MFLTDGQITQSVADLLKQQVSSLPSNYANLITEAHAAAYNEMVGRLLRRGYNTTQINAWDQGTFYERMISLYFILVNVAGTFGYDDRWVKQYDRRADLDTVLVSVGGVFIVPGDTTGNNPGNVGTGAIAADTPRYRNKDGRGWPWSEPWHP